MATLALGVAGAVGGTFIGIGPQAGFLIGSTIGRLLFPPDPIVTEGPRLGDLSVSASVYGKAIPVGYGTIRMPGNMLWTSGIREVENRQETGGGKGGALGGAPAQEQVTYTYFASFAHAFAEGPAEDVIRIWADSHLIYDKSSGTSATVRMNGLSFKFYEGSETQTPNGTIEADKGVGQVPAHRGLCYIVFESLPLEKFGNRIPNITAEIAFAAQGANQLRFSDDLLTSEGGTLNGIDTTKLAIDVRRRRIYLHDTTGTQGFRVYNYDTLSQIREQLDSATGASDDLGLSQIYAGADTGRLYYRLGSSNFAHMVSLNPDTLTLHAESSTNNYVGSPNDMVEVVIIDALGTKSHALVVGGQFGLSHRMEIWDASDMTLAATDFLSTTTDIRGIALGGSSVGESTVWFSQSEDGNSTITVSKIVFDGVFTALGASSGLGYTVTEGVGTIPASTWSNDASGTAEKYFVYDPSDETLIFIVDAQVLFGSYVFKYDPATDTVLWTAEVGTQAPSHGETMSNATSIQDGLFGFTDASGLACLIDTTDGTVLVSGFDGTTLNGNYDPGGQQFFDAATQSIVSVKGIGGSVTGFVQQLFLNRATGLGVALDTVVEDISGRVGLELADLDTADLVSDTVRGYAITRQTSARQALEPLAQAFVFDGVESDSLVSFIKRGNDPVLTIPEGDLVVINDNTGDVLEEDRTQEVELPERLSITFMDVDSDYEQGTTSAKRILNPSPSMRSRNEQALSFPIAFNTSEGAQIAEKILYTAWNERVTYNFKTSWEYLKLNPTDVVNVTVGSTTLQLRITEATVNADGSVSYKGLREDKVTVASDATSQGSLGFVVRENPAPVSTRLFMMDIPLLRDVDDIGRVGNRTYLAMSGYTEGFRSGTLMDSANNLTYANTGIRLTSGISWGVTVNALPNTTTPFQTDTTNTLQVAMQVGELASVATTDFLNDENVALIGTPGSDNWEIILFQDAVETTQEGLWDVSTIIRGRRGTEVNVGAHTTGELFIVMTRAALAAYNHDLSLFGVSRFYRGVGEDGIVEDADTETLSGVFNSLKPYAPTLLDAVVDGSSNIDLSWVRRTRVGGALRDGVGTVPLSEDTESYEIDIMDGVSVARTLTAVTNSDQYDNADIVTDFGGVPASLTFRVYQMSAQVGRGFEAEATITF